jgi:hypothetical protein
MVSFTSRPFHPCRYRYQKGKEFRTCDIDKLKDPETVRKYVNTLTVKAECDEHTTEKSNGKWATYQQIIKKAGGDVVKEEGRRPPKKIGSVKNVKK